MPGSKSNFFERAVLDWAFPPTGSATAFTPPATLYVALCTGNAPTADPASLAEPSGNGYARVPINNTLGTTSAWGPATTDQGGATTKKNLVEIEFPQATASWGSITWFAITDGTGAGANIILWGTLNTPVSINTGDTAVFRVNGITIQED